MAETTPSMAIQSSTRQSAALPAPSSGEGITPPCTPATQVTHPALGKFLRAILLQEASFSNEGLLERRGYWSRQRSSEMARQGLIVDFSRGERYHPAMKEPFFKGRRDFDPYQPKSDFLSGANSPALAVGRRHGSKGQLRNK